jgi:NAD(P)-dependent dehydrogenase (short-subunit alcohol dehydrogenase family)
VSEAVTRVVVITGGSDGIGAEIARQLASKQVMTAKGKLGRVLKLFAPGLVEKIALAALKDDLRPH